MSRLRPYEGAVVRKSVIQIFTTFVPYLVLMAAMFFILEKNYPYWVVFLLSIVASGFFLRIFILFHDCSHNSFFRSSRACSFFGSIFGFVTFTPFADWQYTHSIHHATSSNLEKRGTGDVWTMTVDEYRSAPKWKRLKYRIFRNPLVLFVIGPLVLVLLLNRLPNKNLRKKEILAVLVNNLMIAVFIVIAYFTIGIKHYLIVQLPVLYLAGVAGVWLFYVQHQFDGVYWSRGEGWDPVKAAMKGSSFYKLPGLFRWFSGSIGYHHIHHLRPKIPNYNLKKCYEDIRELQEIIPVTPFKGFRSMFLHLWDEKEGKLVGFSAVN